MCCGMNKNDDVLTGKHCYLRPVREEDASFVVELRTDSQRARFISQSVASVNEQVQWIKSYQQRHQAGKEHYFIACSHDGCAWGTSRLYDIDGFVCTGGSWVMLAGAPLGVALEAYLLPMRVAFSVLGLTLMHIEVRRANTRVWRWHESCGARFVREDAMYRYYDYMPAAYPLAERRVYALI